jgi:hypothetical protein
VRIGSDGRRYFGDGDTCDEGHMTGDRHDDGGQVTEWTGTAWTKVCDRCDLAMAGRNGRGELCCATCGGTYREAARQA